MPYVAYKFDLFNS